MFRRTHLNPAAKQLANEIYNRSWRFIEGDPLLEGEDREHMQEQLAHFILRYVSAGDTNLIHVANQAIYALRQKYDRRRLRMADMARVTSAIN
jgi:hypothetical protein